MRFRPIIRTLVVYGLLGVVASVLTSWAIHTVKFWPQRAGPHPLAWRSHFRNPIDEFDRLWVYQLEWPEYRGSTNVDIEPVSFEGGSAMGWRLARGGALIKRRDLDGFPITYDAVEVLDSGWPMLGMRAVNAWSIDPPNAATARERTSPAFSISGGLRVWSAPGPMWPAQPSTGLQVGPPPTVIYRFALPLAPLWPGFVVNSAVYGVLLLVVIRLPGILLADRRSDRGLCAGCGYDVGATSRRGSCPECGRPISTHKTE